MFKTVCLFGCGEPLTSPAPSTLVEVRGEEALGEGRDREAEGDEVER